MSQNQKIDLNKDLLAILDCPKCKLGKGVDFVDETKLNCPVCQQDFTMKRVDGSGGEGLLIPDFFEFEEKA
jgi:hypothetical protein